MARQEIVWGMAGPVYVNETAARQEIVATVYVNETSAVSGFTVRRQTSLTVKMTQ